MDQRPYNLPEEAFQVPTNDLIQPAVIHSLEEVTEVVPEPMPVNPPNPQQPRGIYKAITR